MSFSKVILRSGYHVLDGGRWLMVSAHLRRLGIPYWVKTLRKHRAIRNGRYLTRAHLARRPRAFHPVRVGDAVQIWWNGLHEVAVGRVFDIHITSSGKRWVCLAATGKWYSLANTDWQGWSYVH